MYREAQRRLGEYSKVIEKQALELSLEREKHALENRQHVEFYQKVLKQFDEERVHYKREIQVLEKLVFTKCRELYRMRTISAAILQKRTNLEQTLYNCLDETFKIEEEN